MLVFTLVRCHQGYISEIPLFSQIGLPWNRTMYPELSDTVYQKKSVLLKVFCGEVDGGQFSGKPGGNDRAVRGRNQGQRF